MKDVLGNNPLFGIRLKIRDLPILMIPVVATLYWPPSGTYAWLTEAASKLGTLQRLVKCCLEHEERLDMFGFT